MGGFGIVIAWIFGAFIFFKVPFDYGIEDISIVGALLCAVVFGATVFVASGIYAARLLRFNWSPGAVPARLSTLVAKTGIFFVLLAAVYALITRLVIFGFSKDLSRDIGMFDYRDRIDESFIAFLFIVLSPLLLHYILSIAGTYLNANSGARM